MNFTPTQQKPTLIKHTVTRLRLGFTVESCAVSMSCCVSGKEAGGEQKRGPCSLCGRGSQGHLLDVRNQMPLSGFSGIIGQCQPR